MPTFQLKVRDRPYEIIIGPDHLKVEGFELTWEVVRAEGERLQVAIEGILYDVELRQEEGRTVAVVDGQAYPVEAIGLVRGRPAPRREEVPAAPPPEKVEGALTAMMPSKVIAVHVQVGDQVEAGQVVLVLEAMKMESELQAPRAGTVTAVNCAPGDSVDAGAPLVVIE